MNAWIGWIGWLAVAQQPVAGAAPAAAPAGAGSMEITSAWDFVVKGGPIMIAIGLVSLVALAVAIERIVLLRRAVVIPPAFLPGVTGLRADKARALEYCRADDSPIARLIAAALRKQGQPVDVLTRGMEEAGHRELTRFRKRMRLMSALPQISTMLGLLGTIFGMIKTFQAVAASGQALGKTETLAKGIFEAWTATAGGLLVAIPVLAGYHVLMGMIDTRMSELDVAVSDWMEAQSAPAGVAALAPSAGAAHAPAVPLQTPHRAPETAPMPVAAV